MIADRNTDGETAAEFSGGRRRDSAFLQSHQNIGIYVVELLVIKSIRNELEIHMFIADVDLIQVDSSLTVSALMHDRLVPVGTHSRVGVVACYGTLADRIDPGERLNHVEILNVISLAFARNAVLAGK